MNYIKKRYKIIKLIELLFKIIKTKYNNNVELSTQVTKTEVNKNN